MWRVTEGEDFYGGYEGPFSEKKQKAGTIFFFFQFKVIIQQSQMRKIKHEHSALHGNGV